MCPSRASQFPRSSFSPSCSLAMGRYPWTEVLLFEVLSILFFYPTSHHVYRVVVFAATIHVATQIYATPEAITHLTVASALGCRIVFQVLSAAYILGTEGSFPDNRRRVRDEVHGETDAGRPSNFPVTKKLWWMIDLAYSPRMVGWVQEPRGCLQPPPSPSRRKFLWKTFGKLVLNIAILDLTTLFPRYPAFDSVAENTLGEVPFLRRLPYVLLLGCTLAHGFDCAQNFVALVCVGLGRSSPTLWPNMMGRWRDAYTLRRFWGYVCQGVSRLLRH
jgi:hypothetical protein